MTVLSGDVQRRHAVIHRLVDIRDRIDQRPHYRLVACFSGNMKLHFVTWAAIRVRPLQHLEMPALRRHRARKVVPRASACARPLQHLEMPTPRRVRARRPVPQAAVRAQPLQHLEMPAVRRCMARFRVPRPAVRAQNLQLLELSTPRRCRTKEFLTRQAPSPLHALYRAQTSEVHDFTFL